MANQLILLGAGGNAHDVLDIVEAVNLSALTWRVLGFLQDGRAPGESYLGHPILGRLDAWKDYTDSRFLSTIRNERTFRQMPQLWKRLGLASTQFASLVHPNACVSSRATLGRGVYVCAGAQVGGNVVLEDHVSIGPGAIIGHDSHLASHTVVAAGAIISGGVSVNSCCYVGSGASVKQGLEIGEESLIGMGAVVIHDVSSATVVAGNPARPVFSLQWPARALSEGNQ